MKKITFGCPEEHVPSKYCSKFSYTESEISYPIEKINFDVNSRGCVLEFPCEGNEQFYGLGLQLKRFNLTGGKFALRPNADPMGPTGDSHAPVPFFVSTAGYGIFVDTARQMEVNFNRKKITGVVKQTEKKISMSTEELYATGSDGDASYVVVQIPVAKGVDIYVIEGETISQVVAQYNMLAGGGCMPPLWGLGGLILIIYNSYYLSDTRNNM